MMRAQQIDLAAIPNASQLVFVSVQSLVQYSNTLPNNCVTLVQHYVHSHFYYNPLHAFGELKNTETLILAKVRISN